MESFVQSLAKVGERTPFSIETGFQSYPDSLREMIRIMNLPDPKLGKLQKKKIHTWGEEGKDPHKGVYEPQGVTYAYGNIWFLSSRWLIAKYSFEGPDLYVPSKIRRLKIVTLEESIKKVGLKFSDYDHIGDIEYFEGLIFAPVRRSTKKPPHILLALTDNLEMVGYAKLSLSTSDLGCAINPWNRLLYIPSVTKPGCLDAYDISEFHTILPDRNKWGKRVNIRPLKEKVFSLYKKDASPEDWGGQGLLFSPNGRLYITQSIKNTWWDNYLHVYNALTGIKLDVLGENDLDFEDTGDEIEGLSLHPSGIIYIAVSDWEAVGYDDFHIYGFKYPNLTDPV